MTLDIKLWIHLLSERNWKETKHRFKKRKKAIRKRIHTYAVVDGGDLAAGILSELGQQVQNFQRGHEEHEVRQGEEHRYLPVRFLVHILADQHTVVLCFAEVAQDLHGLITHRNTTHLIQGAPLGIPTLRKSLQNTHLSF